MQKILIIKLGALGDVIMSTPLIRQIQNHHKESQVYLLTSPSFQNLFHSAKNFEVRSFPRHGLAAATRTIGWIRKQRFSSIYDLQSNDRSAIYCALSGVSRRVGNHLRFPYNLHPKQKWVGQCHIFDRMLEVLRSGGIDAEYEAPALSLLDSDKAFVGNWLKQKKLVNERIVIMHAGGSPQHPQKRWPFFAQLASELDAANYQIVWVGGSVDAETNRLLSKTAGIDATNAFSLPQLVVLGQFARFAVANDSGPMHVLSCSNIPIYGLFGPTDWRRNHALGQKDYVLSLDLESEQFVPQTLKDLKFELVLQRLKADKRL